MSDQPLQPQLADPRRVRDGANDGDPAWSDSIIGIGFFPDEVGLDEEWSWSAHGLRP
jgi:hypothetical protein